MEGVVFVGFTTTRFIIHQPFSQSVLLRVRQIDNWHMKVVSTGYYHHKVFIIISAPVLLISFLF